MGGKHFFPVVLHVDHDPTFLGGVGVRLVEAGDVRLASLVAERIDGPVDQDLLARAMPVLEQVLEVAADQPATDRNMLAKRRLDCL